MHIRDRIIELRRVHASTLRPHPKNWRTHPTAQRDSLRGLLSEIGYAGALLARELEDGSLELIDGHLRAETTPDAVLPVLVLDVSPEEAEKLLATHDPLGAMAGVDRELLDSLLANIETENEAVCAMLDELRTNVAENERPIDFGHEPKEVTIPRSFQLVVECDDEQAQRDLYERLTAERFRCRVLTL
jgi:hypothetical protein